MFTTIRRYEGVTDTVEATKRVREEFVPLISSMPGFVSYYWVDVGNNTMLSVSVFSSLSKAIESNEKAGAWVNSRLKQVMPKNPVIVSGQVMAFKT
jgi:heme-degrading monooxygenase HmoA